MAYTKQNFTDGEILTAEHLNHIEQGISDLNGVYELIDTITLEEDAALDISEEPDGTPYKFKAVMVHMTTDTTVTAGNFYYYSNTTAVGLSYISVKTTTTTGYSLMECHQYMGLWLPKWRNGWGTTASSTYMDRQNYNRWRLYPIADYPYITRLKVSSTVLPAGTTIEIWGVRA